MTTDCLHILDRKGERTGFIMVRKPFSSKKKWNKVRKRYRHRMLGMTCCAEFPMNESASKDILEQVSGWCSCFRKGTFDFHGRPVAFISRSDFTDWKEIQPKKKRKKYDFVFTCLNSGNQRRLKNLNLMNSCLRVLCGNMKLKGLYIGQPVSQIPLKYRKYITCLPRLRQDLYYNAVASAKCSIFPQVRDASPRVLTESLCLNVPILVNEKIYGGWKYVNKQTGIFFNGVDDVGIAMSKLLGLDSSPRQWFTKNYGLKQSSVRLAKFMRQVFGDKYKGDYAILAESGP